MYISFHPKGSLRVSITDLGNKESVPEGTLVLKLESRAEDRQDDYIAIFFSDIEEIRLVATKINQEIMSLRQEERVS